MTVALAMLLVAACVGPAPSSTPVSAAPSAEPTSASSPESPPPASSNDPSTLGATPSSGQPNAALGDLGFLLPDDLLTAAPTQRELTIDPATKAAVSKVIGSKGGTILATGSDGSTFSLEIPANDLPFPITITVTPVNNVTGLPFDAPPAHRLGVEFSPEGLEFATPARLTITSTTPFDPSVLTQGFRGDRRYLGAFASDIATGSLVVPIDHFSGYVATWPMTEPDFRRIAREFQAAEEFSIRNEIAAILSYRRQRAELGLPNPPDRVVAENYNSILRQLIAQRLAMAGRGCHEVHLAFLAVLEYRRTMQLLGVADELQFKLEVPDWLSDLSVDLCWPERFERCRRSGDFPGFAVYLLSQSRQHAIAFGKPLSAAQIAEGTAYLKRCGQWTLSVVSKMELHVSAPLGGLTDAIEELRRQFELKWKPGGGDFGLFGSTIEAKAETEILELVSKYRGCITHHADLGMLGSTAKVTTLEYDNPLDALGEPDLTKPPTFRKFVLAVDIGNIGYGDEGRCPPSNEFLPESPPSFQEAAGVVLPNFDGYVTSQISVTVPNPGAQPDGWLVSNDPFKAAHALNAPWKSVYGQYDVRIEIVLRHTPA